MRHRSICASGLVAIILSLTLVSANPFGLVDTSVYDPTTNTMITSEHNFEIFTENAKAQDADSKDITQYLTFAWAGGVALNTDWLFVYNQPLESGRVSAWTTHNKLVTESYYYNATGSITIYDVISFAPSSDPCDYGNQWNKYKYRVEHMIETVNGTINSSDVYCFNNYVQDGDDYTLTGNYTKMGERQVLKIVTEWVDITDNFQFLGSNLLGHNFQYYYVKDVSFDPDDSYKTRWTYTPYNRAKSGKWYVFGKPHDLTLQQAISSNQYIFQDPWWNSTYAHRRRIFNLTSVTQPINASNVYSPSDIDNNEVDEWIYAHSNCSYIYYNSDTDIGYINSSNNTECFWFSTTDLTAKGGTVPTRLALYMPFDNTAAVDFARTANGTLGGGVTDGYAGQIHYSYDFDGTTDYVDTNLASATFGNGDYSISMWINADSTALGNQLFSDWYTERSLLIFINAGVLMHYVGTGSSTIAIHNEIPYTDTTSWHHIVATHDVSTKTLKLYVDAGTPDSDVYTGTRGVAATYDFQIGARPLDHLDDFDGRIDDVHMYNVVLNSSEITALYELGAYLGVQEPLPTPPPTPPSPPSALPGEVEYRYIGIGDDARGRMLVFLMLLLPVIVIILLSYIFLEL